MPRIPTNHMKYRPFRRPCRRCDELYQPNSKFSTICSKCDNRPGGSREAKEEAQKKEKTFNQTQYLKEMREVAKDIGNCSVCFKQRDNPKYKLCTKCRKYKREWKRKQQ